MDYRLLGPMEVVDGDTPVALGGLKQRALLARLLVTPNRTVAVERLVDDLWGEAVPETAPKMVQIYVSQLRKVLPVGTLLTRSPGYLVETDAEAIDVARFDRLRRTGRAALEAGETAAAAAELREALALWRGEALAEFAEPFAQTERNHLDELRMGCLEDRIEADLQLGRHADLAGELAAEIARNPLRERLRGQAMLALYRSGRQAEALDVYQDFRRTLAEDLGLEPGKALRDLQARILNQDPTLAPDAVTRAAPDDLQAGVEALGRGAWEAAKAAFARAGDQPEALEGWAQAARFLGEGDASLEARARAFRAYRGREDVRAAARTAAWLAFDTLVFRGDDAVAQGWFGHAHRLLEDVEDGDEHGWLAYLEGEAALAAHGDAARAGEHAARALEIGRRTGAMDLEMLALSLTGLARVAAGEIADGMRELDQATAAAVAGELSGVHFAGAVCCHMIYACERVRDVERAGQWCATVSGFSEEWSVPQLFGFCRSHYASVLIWRGRWDDAEAELAAATSAFELGAPALVYESILRLAELRRRQGRLDEADRAQRADRVASGGAALPRGDRARPRRRARRPRPGGAAPAGAAAGRAPGAGGGARARRPRAGHRRRPSLPPRPPRRSSRASWRPARPRRCARRCASREGCWPGPAATRRRPGGSSRTPSTSGAGCGRPTSSRRGRIALAELAIETGRRPEAERELRLARAALQGLSARAELERAEALLALTA